ncbi:hypothetical protein HGG64_01665 [Mycoplasma phocoeninasale]|uniref:Uncharacterized protein n=1 Tax=Mycoplasma phocoeninasale TaxID=2726117 RepID=A0A858U025_9MOLU|nr:hypothetical protein [Mycoplasma phocoeninasale]QJG66414.1 hypothetical protein HGG64_01665 [Mycoplasma phocoeninasale]
MTKSLNSDNGIENVFETEYVDYSERTEDEFIVINFTDEKDFNCEAKISHSDIHLAYAAQRLYLKKHQRIVNKLMLNEKEGLNLEFYLKEVEISPNIIAFSYDILSGGEILVENRAEMLIK